MSMDMSYDREVRDSSDSVAPLGCGLLLGGIMPPPVKMPIRAVRAALVWFRKTTALDGKAGIGAGAAIDPVAPIPDLRRVAVEPLESTDAPRPKSFKKGKRSFASSWLRRILRQRRCSGQGAGQAQCGRTRSQKEC